MKERIYAALSSVCEAFQYSPPEDYEALPVLWYHIVDEQYATVQDDRETNLELVVSVSLFQEEDDEELIADVQRAMQEEFPFCYMQSKMHSKEDGTFRTIFEFMIHDL
ncbi:hypothetical protein FZC84_21255 [Rossellomorea vietnamensis]|uniref:DUF3168 domain-containing protein n=1 Tax=Rossellomorea vietnamensis TaxID=218284 RepID=A0A5D4M2C6_9BACI|nr:hypothetical protein [Rossellomorea vietnamensis]TYR95722.1 hypothetical protein FZC84_21255 [Rossellomorea vietnamensis]